MNFRVVDKTGKIANLKELAEENWVKGRLMEMDLAGFMLFEDGQLYLADDCDNIVACPPGRFAVERWTGLYDENKKEIYEGDIVVVHDVLGEGDCAKFVGVVDFCCGSFMIEQVDDATKHYRWADYEVEVVGREHDDTDLWEDEK